MQPISPSPPQLPLPPPTTAPGTSAAGAMEGHDFRQLLVQGLGEVNSMQFSADQAIEKLVTGGDTTPAEVLTAVQKADMAFRMMMQVRNKLIQAYQEIKEIRI